MNNQKNMIYRLFLLALVGIICVIGSCKKQSPTETSSNPTVPHAERFGIYALDLETETVELIISSAKEFSKVRLNHAGDTFVFSQKIDGDDNEHTEIFTHSINGSNLQRLTQNTVWDIYPSWSNDDAQIAFLSFRDTTLDIYIMNANGTNQRKLYDSGFHDADIHWIGDKIAFTRNSQIWTIKSDGTQPTQITDPPNAGVWGNAVLPFGDYDPRIRPDESTIVFERMVSDSSEHGCYDIFTINMNGINESRLTQTGYTQGLANWSYAGDKIVYTVSAIGEQGVFDIYLMNADGTNNRNITPDYFPDTFLCHCPLFSSDDTKIYFVGEWWE